MRARRIISVFLQWQLRSDNKLLYSELGTFSYKLTKTGNITYAAIDGKHDDTVTSLGIALQCKQDFQYKPINKDNFVRSNIKLFA